nr:response regulator [Massilia norwichensis]
MEAIFDVFVQVDVAIDRSRGGLGIGLSLVRALVGLHGGSVRAQSEGLGHGSSFVVELPLSGAAAAAPDAGLAGASAGASGTGCLARRIALVEDNADARHTLQQLLSAMGHTVVTASNGPEGLDLITTYRPDVAFVDIGLPGIDGFELARHARRLLGGHKLRLVALTGYSSAAVRSAAMEAGFDLHLVKPCPPEKLAEAVATLD